jgi:catechol 2,3-dioxygenase
LRPQLYPTEGLVSLEAKFADTLAQSIDPATTLGPVTLTVADLERARSFYERAIGLWPVEQAGDTVLLGSDEKTRLVELVGQPDAPRRPRGTAGLFHLAVLVPSRRELARAVRRVVSAGWRFTGASDHLVSEALYLDDPEGNGIEIYRDRPREEWRYVDGALRMATEPIDFDGVMAELPPEETDAGVPAGTRMGHVHLQISDLAAAERFYHGVLGFDVTVRGYPGALFVSAGGYHHHVGLNTWASEGALPPPGGSRGLERFEVVVPGTEELERVAARVEAAGHEHRRDGRGLLLPDPSGNRVLVTAGAATS